MPVQSNHMEGMKAVLIAARKLIATPEAWCRAAWAERADGTTARPREPEACRWCALGAIRRAAAGDMDLVRLADEQLGRQLATIVDSESWRKVAMFNDREMTSHSDVLGLYDRAIEACR